MRIRWSPGAADDLERLYDHIRTDRPEAARRVVEGIYERAATLADHPYIGRLGRVRSTRELTLTPLPFIVVYRVLEHVDAVEIVNVIHGARRWPPAS